MVPPLVPLPLLRMLLCKDSPGPAMTGAAGVQDLSWDLVAKHLGRGKRSVMRKYDNLRTGMMAAGEMAGFLI